MNATQEVVMLDNEVVERRVFVYPEQDEIESLERHAYQNGYKSGCRQGFWVGSSILALLALCIWLIAL